MIPLETFDFFRKEYYYFPAMAGSGTGNMTEGNPLVLILKFTLPLLMGNLFQQAYNVADAVIVGQVLGAKALAGVGASSSVQFLILGFCIGLCGGFSIPVAQSFGAKDRSSLRKYIFHSFLIVGILSLVITLLCVFICDNILMLLRTPDDIYNEAYIYLMVIFIGIPFTLLYNITAGILRAVGDSRDPFMFLAVSTVLNIGLDLVFILVLKLGVAGAGIATVASQALSGFLCLIFIIKKDRFLLPRKEEMAVRGRYIKTLFGMGLPMGMQYSITAVGSMVMQSANNSLGSIYVSAFTAGTKIKQFTICPVDALATAVSTYAGQNYGSGNVQRIRKGYRISILISMIYAAIAGVLLILFGRSLSSFFVGSASDAILDSAARYLRAIGLFLWALGILNVSRLTVQGLGFSSLTILSGVSEMAARILMSILAVPVFGYSAICFTDQSAWLAACFYIVPLCFICINKVDRQLKVQAGI